MTERSDEVTESRDTEDLLEETERLLSESGDGTDAEVPSEPEETPSRNKPSTDSAADSWWRSSGDSVASSDSSTEASWRSRLVPRPSLTGYFSPKAFLTFVLLIGAGLLAGGMVIPIAGRMIGMFAVAFLVGLFTSRRRYLEMAATGTSVGAVSAVASNTFLALAGSAIEAVVAVGVTAGLVACLAGYYFGRDLRNGLVHEVDS